MYVIGTAGHVDHGKSSFLRALTGMEPDRLPEEKKRGMTIDLNFVWIPGQKSDAHADRIGIIDVPGHHRFVKNMISGVMNINAFLFIVAADDGWMPQSQEHLDVLQSLGVTQGLALVTKTDLVDEGRVKDVKAQVDQHLKDAYGNAFPILTFSAEKPDNLPEIREAIYTLIGQLPSPRQRDQPRLWVDRVFMPKGLGVIATGTLTEGTLSAGDELTLFPGGQVTQVKSLQSYQHTCDVVQPVSRVAVQLSKIQAEQIDRGSLLQKNAIFSTQKIDAKVTFFDQPPKKNIRLAVHLGTLRREALIIPLTKTTETGDKTNARREIFVRIKFEEPTPARMGDRFLLRTPGEEQTLAGGVVIDTKGEHSHRAALERLSHWKSGPEGAIEFELLKKPWVSVAALSQHSIYSQEELEKAGHTEDRIEIPGLGIALKGQWKTLCQTLLDLFKQAHQSGKQGLDEGALAKALPALPKELIRALLEYLKKSGKLQAIERGYQLAGQKITLSPEETRYYDAIKHLFAQNPLHPISLKEIAGNPQKLKALVHRLAKEGHVVSIADSYIMDKTRYEEVKQKIAQFLHEKQQATTSELKSVLNISRKNAVMLFEKMDRDRLTYLKEGVRRLLKR